MSKSKGNVVTPDEIIARYGADTGRLFILFAAPPEKDLDWSDQGVEGCYRFLRRVWRLFQQHGDIFTGAGDAGLAMPAPGKKEEALRRACHGALKKVTVDIGERFNFNTAISAIMEQVNALYNYLNEAGEADKERFRPLLREVMESTVLMLAPFAPHISEELWQLCGYQDSVHSQGWPVFDPRYLEVDEVEMVIQVNGKVRGRMVVSAAAAEDELLEEAREHEKVQPFLEGKEIKKIIAVPGKLVNIVVR